MAKNIAIQNWNWGKNFFFQIEKTWSDKISNKNAVSGLKFKLEFLDGRKIAKIYKKNFLPSKQGKNRAQFNQTNKQTRREFPSRDNGQGDS